LEVCVLTAFFCRDREQAKGLEMRIRSQEMRVWDSKASI
jgi:hypothetical protein